MPIISNAFSNRCADMQILPDIGHALGRAAGRPGHRSALDGRRMEGRMVPADATFPATRCHVRIDNARKWTNAHKHENIQTRMDQRTVTSTLTCKQTHTHTYESKRTKFKPQQTDKRKKHTQKNTLQRNNANSGNYMQTSGGHPAGVCDAIQCGWTLLLSSYDDIHFNYSVFIIIHYCWRCCISVGFRMWCLCFFVLLFATATYIYVRYSNFICIIKHKINHCHRTENRTKTAPNSQPHQKETN